VKAKIQAPDGFEEEKLNLWNVLYVMAERYINTIAGRNIINLPKWLVLFFVRIAFKSCWECLKPS
jgi:hypothetical protein